MVQRRVSQTPLDIVRDLLVLDRWTASRALPGDYRTGDDTSNPIEAAFVALHAQPALGLGELGLFQLDPDEPVADLVGAGPNEDLLRDGADDLAVTVRTGEDGITVELPGLLRPFLEMETYRRDLSSDYAIGTVQVKPIELRPKGRIGDLRIQWGAAVPELVVTVDFETEDVDVTGAVTIDWTTMTLRLHARPRVVGERLLWDFGLRVVLAPRPAAPSMAAAVQQHIEAAIHDAVEPILAEWGALAMHTLLLLPLRPMRDDTGFFDRLADADTVSLGLWLLDQLYHPDVPTEWLDRFIDSCLLPHQPLRVVSLDPANLASPLVDVFRARLADVYVRHVAPPTVDADAEDGPALVFDVEPIEAGGVERRLSDPDYGVWRRPRLDQPPSNGVHCVVREHHVVELDHLRLTRRSYRQAAGGQYRVRVEILVRHPNLASGAWTRVQRPTFATDSANPLLPGTTASRWFEWLEVGGEVRVRGEVEDGSGRFVAWFDQSRGVRALPSVPGGLPSDGGAMTLADHEPDGAPPFPRELRARALVRLVQRTSLRTDLLDWLGLRLVELTVGGRARRDWLDRVATTPVPDAAALVVRVNGRMLAVLPISAQELGELQAGRPLRFPSSAAEWDLYLLAGQESLLVRLELATLRSDGDLDVVLAVEHTVLRDDPDLPGWRWHVPPGLEGAHVRVDHGSGVRARLFLRDRQFDATVLPLADVPKRYDVGITRLEVTQPTEPWPFNLRAMHFTVRFWVELDGQRVGPERSLHLGPFPQATPAEFPLAGLARVFDDDDYHRRLHVPDGGVVRMSVSGREAAAGPIPVGETDLGTATHTFAVTPAEDPPEGQEVVSESTDYFHFRCAIATATKPPAPEFTPGGSASGEGDVELTIPPGTGVPFTYGTVSWTTDLRLQVRDGHEDSDETEWRNVESLTVTPAGSGTIAADASLPEQRRYRLRARNVRGDRSSRVLVLTVE